MATIVDTKALLETVVYSLAAGVGVTLIFSVAIFGMARFAELGREGRNPTALVFGTLAMVAIVAFCAAITLGIIVMTSK